MAIRVVLFDWGGTIALTEPAPPSAAYEAVARYARHKLFLALRTEVFELACREAASHADAEHSLRIDELLNAAFERLGWSIDPDDIAACSRLFFEQATATDTVLEDAMALLVSLKSRGYRIGVVADAPFPGSMYAGLLAEVGVARYLDAFVTTADVQRPKPAPDVFLHALTVLRADPHVALFVGDTVETDIAGARAAGLRAVLVDRLGRQREAAGYLVVDRLQALNQFLGEGAVG